MEKFIKRFNDYSCIKKNDTEDIINLSHYTSNLNALSNICNGEFWATDIRDFGDKCEGRLILQRINEIISAIDCFSNEQKQCVCNLIGSDSKIEEFISNHRTAVLSMCLNTDSEYLWDNYARENGYNIIFDKKAFRMLKKNDGKIKLPVMIIIIVFLVLLMNLYDQLKIYFYLNNEVSINLLFVGIVWLILYSGCYLLNKLEK